MKQIKNALMDNEFLKKLDAHRNREVFARIISLDFNENPIEQIEGRVTGGSINVDGTSAVRRTCSLSMVAKEMNINEFFWGLYSKFKLEIGLKNLVDDKYPEIITSFGTSQSTNNYTVSISGKDKMCLLNGEVGGNLPASVDFGMREEYDEATDSYIYESIPIKAIIREALHAYALEPYHNIIINDLEAAGLELMEYRGEEYIYFLYNIDSGEYENATLNGDKEFYLYDFENKKITSELVQLKNIENFYTQVGLIDRPEVTYIATKIDNNGKEEIKVYQVARIGFGDTAGYRITDLVYAGDLISAIGDTLTSILDKIKGMLGEFEYFYDLDGRFIFQRKKNYLNRNYDTIVDNSDEGRYAVDSAYHDSYIYTFENGSLITAYQNSPNLINLRNDYSIWGNRKSASGAEVPIHYRFAIDNKPTRYKTIAITSAEAEKLDVKAQESTLYSVEKYDWREIIYRMASDYYQYNQLEDFDYRIIEANGNLYPNGKTGYEQYYIDIQGFWRQLYNPEAKPSYVEYENSSIATSSQEFIYSKEEFPYGVFIKKGFVKYGEINEDGIFTANRENEKTQSEIVELRNKVYVHHNCYQDEDEKNTKFSSRTEMTPLLDYVEWHPKFDNETSELQGFIKISEADWPIIIPNKKGNSKDDEDKQDIEYIKYVVPHGSEADYKALDKTTVERVRKQEVYVGYYNKEGAIKFAVPLIMSVDPDKNWYLEEEFKNYKTFEDPDSNNNNNNNGGTGTPGEKPVEIELIDSDLEDIYRKEDKNKVTYYNYLINTQLDIYGDPVENEEGIYSYNYKQIKYYNQCYDYYRITDTQEEKAKYLHWNKNVVNAPETLNFWMDFLDVDGELNQFSVPVVGDRTKVVNDKDVKSIYFKEVSEVIYIPQTKVDHAYDLIENAGYWNYKLIRQIPENYFSISARGKSAHEALEELLYNYSYCVESINLTTIPIYYLTPNTRILVKDDSNKINGEYLVSRFTIPLTYNGNMTITATKAPTRLY